MQGNCSSSSFSQVQRFRAQSSPKEAHCYSIGGRPRQRHLQIRPKMRHHIVQLAAMQRCKLLKELVQGVSPRVCTIAGAQCRKGKASPNQVGNHKTGPNLTRTCAVKLRILWCKNAPSDNGFEKSMDWKGPGCHCTKHAVPTTPTHFYD